MGEKLRYIIVSNQYYKFIQDYHYFFLSDLIVTTTLVTMRPFKVQEIEKMISDFSEMSYEECEKYLEKGTNISFLLM